MKNQNLKLIFTTQRLVFQNISPDAGVPFEKIPQTGLNPSEKPDAGVQNDSGLVQRELHKLADIERVQDIEKAAKKGRELLMKKLKDDVKKNRVTDNFDHYLLGLGDLAIGKRKLSDFPFVQKYNQTLLFGDAFHEGDTSYSLLRAGVDPAKKIRIKKITKPMTVEELIFYPLEHIQYWEFEHGEEWLLLLAVESLKRGRKTRLYDINNNQEIPIETLVESCEEEFEYGANPEAYKKRLAEKHEPFSGSSEFGTCNGLHALDALMAYSLFQKDNAKVREYTDYVFQKIKSLLEKAKKNPDRSGWLEEDMDYLSHLLTVLCQLPKDFHFSNEQREHIKVAMHQMAKDILTYSSSGKETDVGGLSHAIDVMNHMPEAWWK